MEINEIKTKNFKGAPDKEYEFKKINFLIGENGKGKTSLVEALRYLLTGNLPADPVRHGEEYLEVTGAVDGVEMVRTYYLPDQYRINDEPVKEKDFVKKVHEYAASAKTPVLGKKTNRAFRRLQPEDWWNFLETGKSSGSRIMGIKELELELEDGTTIYRLVSKPPKISIGGKSVTAKALKEYMDTKIHNDGKSLDIVTSSSVMSAMQMNEFSEYLVNIIPVKVNFEKLKELAQLTDEEADTLEPLFPKMPDPIVVSDVAAVYKALFAARTDIARQMDEWEKRSHFDGALPLPDKEEVIKLLDGINSKLGAAQHTKKNWEAYEKQVADRNKAIELYKKWAAEYNSMKVQKVSQEVLDEAESNIRKVQSQIEAAIRNNSQLEQSTRMLEKMLANLDATVCPLCDKLTCTTDKTECREDIQRTVAGNREMAQKNTAYISKARTWMKQAEDKKMHLVEAKNAYANKEALYRKLIQLKESIPEEPKKPEAIPETDKLLAAKDKAQRMLGQINVYEECLKAQKKHMDLKQQYQVYNSLVKKAEPRKGLFTNSIIEYVLGPFATHCNEFLGLIYPDIQVSFHMGDKGMEVFCRPHGGRHELPIKALSDGERILILLSLMDMVSSISGTKVLFFDALESLDNSAFCKLAEALSIPEVKERYDCVLLSAVSHGDIYDAVKKMEGNSSDVQLISF